MSAPQRRRNHVDGKPVDAFGTGSFDLVDPATEEVHATSPISVAEDVDAAVDAAAAAFGSWGRTTPAARQHHLLDLATALEEHTGRIVAAQVRETGQPRRLVADDEVAAGTDHLRFFAGAARRLDGVAAGEYLEGFTSYVRREPLGVVAQVTPWNYPFLMALWKVAPALAAGNTVVLKPSDTTPTSTLVLAEVASLVLPPGVLNVVLGDASTGRLLAEHPVPAMVAITGSTRAGRSVAHSAAERLRPSHLELGGKAPAVVHADVDVPDVAAQIADAAFYNTGQDCTAVTRVLVHADVHDEFVAQLAAAAHRTAVDEGGRIRPGYGPLNSARHLAAVTTAVAALPGHATVVTGGHRLPGRGFFYAPTVVTGVRQDDAIVQEEVFGPVVTVQPFATDEEALRLANGVRYGLAASVWTQHHATAVRYSRELDAGAVWINAHIPLAAELPHGGFKESGHGKDLSAYSLEEYTRVKHVMSAHR
ncbi:aminobutyraldehyde dehydrogenase [Kineococcus glutinatus]|uniref:Gamma-aminobutyraldehyde dehydrogenase n=1 Tax=Kineococcus glutinatus TaxID=1070872 RepID=A0ABP9H6S0_9ACTN